MIYVDTSLLVPLYIREPASGGARAWFGTVAQGEAAISEWTRTEFASALGIMVRMRRLKKQLAREIITAFNRLAEESLVVLIPGREDFVQASRYLEQFEFGLRAGDALHLAIALNHGAKAVYSLDRTLVECAHKLKLNALIPV